MFGMSRSLLLRRLAGLLRPHLCKRLHLLIALLLSLRQALNHLVLRGRSDGTRRNELGKTGQRLEHCLAGIRAGADLRQNFLKLLNDEPQPLQSSRLIASIRCRLRCGSLPERRRLLRLGWINGWGCDGHELLALVLALTVVREH